MPTNPLKELVKLAIRKELLTGDDPTNPVRVAGQRKAYVKTETVITEVDGKKVAILKATPGQLPEHMEDFVDALAEALAKIISNLQVVGTTAAVPVVIPVTAPPSLPSAGATTPIPTTPASPNIIMTTLLP